MGGYSWVTLATNDSYSLGALVLAHSLKQVGTKQQLTVLITPGVTQAMRSKLSEVFNVVQEVNILDSKDEANLQLLKRPELGVTFTKLHCWRLTQFDKCVFLDADTLVLENCDELFDREELSAAPDIGWPDCFNSGVFVYRPSNDTYEKLVQFALEKGSFDGGDQGLLNLYFSDWAHKDISKHLPFIYNMASTACYSYLPAFKQFGKTAKIIHFIGFSKPWLQYFDTEKKQVHPNQGFEHLKAILQHWWDVFCSLIYPQLSPDMSGIAGAFAKLTLGQPRTPEQLALDDHLRRQGWEVGNIDYLGRDSFDNIWNKICETLSSSSAPAPPESKDPSPPSSAVTSVEQPLSPEVQTDIKATSEPVEQTQALQTQTNEPKTVDTEKPVDVQGKVEAEQILAEQTATTQELPKSPQDKPSVGPVETPKPSTEPLKEIPEPPKEITTTETPAAVAETSPPVPQSPETVPQSPKPVAPSPEPVAQSPEAIAKTPEPTSQMPELVAQTPELVAQTPELVTNMPEPIAQAPEPASQTPKLVAQTPEPVAQTPEPVAQTPERVAQTPELVAQTPEAVAQIPEPAVQIPAPAAQAPAPAAQTPAPIAQTPVSGKETPKTAIEIPQPATETLKSAETPQPAEKCPKSVVESPQKGTETPKSIEDTSKPVVEPIKQVVESPKPSTEPEKPVPETPKLSTEAPLVIQETHKATETATKPVVGPTLADESPKAAELPKQETPTPTAETKTVVEPPKPESAAVKIPTLAADPPKAESLKTKDSLPQQLSEAPKPEPVKQAKEKLVKAVSEPSETKSTETSKPEVAKPEKVVPVAPTVCPIKPKQLTEESKESEKKSASKKGKEAPKTEVTGTTPAVSQTSPQPKQSKQALSVDTTVPDTPQESATSCPTPPPRKTSGVKKSASKKK